MSSHACRSHSCVEVKPVCRRGSAPSLLHRGFFGFDWDLFPVQKGNPFGFEPGSDLRFKGSWTRAARLTRELTASARSLGRGDMAMELRLLRSSAERCAIETTRRAARRKEKRRGIRRGETRAAKAFDEMDLVLDPETKKPFEIFVQLEQQAVEEARKKAEQVRATSDHTFVRGKNRSEEENGNMRIDESNPNRCIARCKDTRSKASADVGSQSTGMLDGELRE